MPSDADADHIRFEVEETEVGAWINVYDEHYSQDEPAISMSRVELRKLGTAIVEEFGRCDGAE